MRLQGAALLLVGHTEGPLTSITQLQYVWKQAVGGILPKCCCENFLASRIDFTARGQHNLLRVQALFFFSECRAMNLFAAACKLSTASSPEFQHVSAATTISETRTNGQSCLDNLQLRSEVSTSSGHPIPLKQVDRSQRHELSFLQTKSGPSFWESRCRNLVAHAKVSSRQLKFAGWS